MATAEATTETAATSADEVGRATPVQMLAAGAAPPEAPDVLQRSMRDMVEQARRQAGAQAGQAPSGPEDTGSVEGDVDRSDFTQEPDLAAADRREKPAPPPPPKPPTPSGIVEAKNVPAPPPKPAPKKIGKSLVHGPRGRKAAGGPGAKGAPTPGQVVQKPAPPLPPRYTKPKKGGTLPPPPAPTQKIKPARDPAFSKVVAAAHLTVKKARKHPKGKDEAASAQGAAVPPANDIDAQAKANRADTMATAKPQPFNEDAFVAAVEAAMRQAAPKNLNEAGDVDSKADNVKGAIGQKVNQGKDAAGGDVETKSAQPPDPATATPKPVTPMAPLEIEQPGGMQASGAMPAPVPNNQVDLRNGPAKVDNEMASADVTEEQLAQSNEPEFTGALDAKKEGEDHAQQAPADVRKAEAGILKQAAVAAAADEKKTVGDAQSVIGSTVGKVAAGKDDTKSKDELKRKEVADHINSIFDKTKSDVEDILGGIDTKVDEMFTTGEAEIRKNFTTDWNRRLDAYKDDRYSGWRGPFRWARDKFRGLPARANELFAESKAVYERDMQKLIRGIAKTVSSALTSATVRIEQGRGEVSTYVSSLKGDLAKFGEEAAADLSDKFDSLDSSVKDKFDDLAGSLAKKYQESRAAVDEEIEAAKEANKGLIDKAIDAVKGVIRVIAQLKDMILNVLSRIASVIGEIVAHPIKFLKNFVSAVKAGITRFMDRIGEHLQKGLMGWLFGALDAKGIEIPDSFSIEGIFKLVLSVLGVTWTFVREKIAKKIGEPAMAALEAGADIIKKVVTGGPGVLWEMLLEKFTEFQDMVIGEIKSFVMEKVVKSGITFLISLLNPAAAFIKACKMIYDVVMFFVEKGSEIKEFVDTIIDAAGDIARGGTGGVAEKIEGVLAKLLPLAISFLASILGLGGVGEKVRGIIDKVRKPIHKAMDKVVDVVVKMTAPIWKPAKKLFEKGKKLYGKAKAKVVGAYEKGKAKVKEIGTKAKDFAKKGVAKVKGAGKKVKDTATAAKDKVVALFKPQKQPTTMKGASHTLIAEPQKSGRFKIYMQSEKDLLSHKIKVSMESLEKRMANEQEPMKSKTAAQIRQLGDIRAMAQLLEDRQPDGQKVTALGAPPGFEKEMRLLAEEIRQHGTDFGVPDITKAAAGTQVDMKQLASFGMPVPSYMQAQAIADKKNATIDIRATTAAAPELLAEGALPKSEGFKQKTMNEFDEMLGAPPEFRDRVVWFLPSRPKEAAWTNLPQDVARKLWARWRQRKDEYYANRSSIKKQLKENQIAIRPGGTASSGGGVQQNVKGVEGVLKQVAYTGDHDVYRVHGNATTVIEALKAPPFRVQHGAHMDWPTAVQEAKGRQLSAMERDIFAAIVSKHLPGGEALLRIIPHEPPETAYGTKLDFGAARGGGGSGPDLEVVDLPSPEQNPASNANSQNLSDDLRAQMAKPPTKDPDLTKFVDAQYRENATIGSGSTAAAVRYEKRTGKKVGGKDHTQKAEDGVRFLEHWLKTHPTADRVDRAAAENVLRDLKNALAGR